MPADFPDWLEPMAATLTQDRFTGPEWLFERKYDGIRLLAFRNGTRVELYSRNRLRQNIPSLADAMLRLPVRNVILDGEITWDRSGGFHVFDILWRDGRDLTPLTLDERRSILADLPLTAPMMRVKPIDHPRPWDLACAEGWEGVIAKRKDAPYEHKRSKHWLKMKCEVKRNFVIGGFTDPLGTRVGLGALLVGFYDDHDFVFAGKVGTGFDRALLVDLRARLDQLETPTTPFTRATGLPRLRVHWVRPRVVVEVAFIEWTVHEKLRHSRLLAVRSDADPQSVRRTGQ
jgi:ATP-dependent DNA ligase